MPSSIPLHGLLAAFSLFVFIGCQPAEVKKSNGETAQQETPAGETPAGETPAAKTPAGEASIDELIEQLNSEDDAQQAAAAAKLARMGDDAAPAVEALVKQLADNDAHVRAHAARALGLIGDPAKSTATDLAKLIADEDETVRRAAILALNRIELDDDLVVPLMIEALGNADPHIVALATHNLAEVGTDIVPAMIKAMDDERTVYWAILVMSEIGADAKDAVPALAKALSHEDEEVRHEAAQALRSIGPAAEPAIPQLIEALDDEFVQMPAALALGSIGPAAKDALEPLSKISKEADDVMEICAIWSVASIEDDDEKLKKETAPALADFLVSDDQAVRRAAALALLQLQPGPEVMAPLIAKVFENASDEARADMIDAISTLGAAAVPRLIQALEIPALREQAIEVLGRLGPDAADAVPALMKYLDDEDVVLRADILFALGYIGPASKPALEAARAAIKEDDEELVVGGVFLLGKLGNEAADCAAAIKELLDGDNPRIQTVCSWALVKIDPNNEEFAEVAIPLMIQALQRDDAYVRGEAAATLGHMGPAAKDAIPKLKELAETDPDQDVRDAAAEALKAIEK